MLRWFLFVFAAVLAVLGTLTVLKSPDWSKWVLALMAGEFGHFLAVASLAVVVLAWCGAGSFSALRLGAILLGLIATGLFLKPTLQARTVGHMLPDKLRAAFGTADLPGRVPFSWGKLFAGVPKKVAPEIFNYTEALGFDFYRASKPNAVCVVLVHGGGWNSGERDELQPFDYWLASRGYAVAAITYRLAPAAIWPAQRDDLLGAIRYLKTHANDLGVDATRLVVFGRSAGGNIAEATVYGNHDPAIRGLIAFYSPADMNFAWKYARDDDVLKSPVLLRQFLGGTPAEAQAAYDSASAILHVTSECPPTLLLHGDLDTLVWNRQSIRLAAKLQEAGVPHALVELPWATHAVEYNLNGPGGQLATYSVEWFLQAVTR